LLAVDNVWSSVSCIVPGCKADADASGFCPPHAAAPKTKRAGWKSAVARKKQTTSYSDVSAVAPRLWVGSRPPVDREIPGVDLLVLCAGEIQPSTMRFAGKILRCPLPDAELTRDEVNRALIASRTVAEALVKKQRVLSTCALGLNRSAFVAGLALGRVTYLSADDVISLIRLRRHEQCLSNAHFCQLLTKFIGSGRSARR
jgi:hypothetical protein